MNTLIRTTVTAAALAAVTAACTASTGGDQDPPPVRTSLGAVRLVAYDGCDDLLKGLRERGAANVGPYGFGGAMPMAVPDSVGAEAKARTVTQPPEHSTTNVHEAGVDEPDLVKTDGDRLITVTDGTLRVIDTAARKVTASLKLTEGEGGYGAPADLLVSGDRALVLMRGWNIMDKPIAGRPGSDTRYVLVDLAGEPKVLGTIRPQGSYVDARLAGSTVRLVTRSVPDIAFPRPRPGASEADRLAANRAAVAKAPAEAWLPEIEITDASGRTTRSRVPCERVSHPADYTGTSMLTVHTIDLAQGITAAGTDPITLAADGDIVYGTGQSLYVASNPRWWFPLVQPPVEPRPMTPGPRPTAVAPAEEPTVTDPPITPTATGGRLPESPTPAPTPTRPPEETEVHRFDITKPGAPAYVASGKVPGRLLNQYALSEHEGHLRVATTRNQGDDGSSAVYVLKADTMEKVGEVGGLGKGERIYSVRFIGPVGYCVTFRQVDPLYTLDLRDPAHPRVTGELKITGYSAYLHPAGEGRLIGIGQEATEQGRRLGTQVSLFDVSDPAAPRRLSRFFQRDSGSSAEWDPHAFLYWPKTGLAVVPLAQPEKSGALVLRIGDDEVRRLGMIEHPERQGEYPYRPVIQRSLVIGASIWTVSSEGVQVNDMETLGSQAWIPLR